MTALSADRPSSNPQDELFGHAPFDESLANSICRYPGNDDLVLALYGPWGSGKSTVLSYVWHFLEQRPEAEQAVIVTFNPWRLFGQENLTRAFLGQLQAALTTKSELLIKLGSFSESVNHPIEIIIETIKMSGRLAELLRRKYSLLRIGSVNEGI